MKQHSFFFVSQKSFFHLSLCSSMYVCRNSCWGSAELGLWFRGWRKIKKTHLSLQTRPIVGICHTHKKWSYFRLTYLLRMCDFTAELKHPVFRMGRIFIVLTLVDSSNVIFWKMYNWIAVMKHYITSSEPKKSPIDIFCCWKLVKSGKSMSITKF